MHDTGVLESRVKDLERKLRLATWAWLSAAGAVLLSRLLSRGTRQGAQTPETQTGVVRARQLIIVDENGAERVVVGPMSDPYIQGKQWKRRCPSTGVQLNDSGGNERGAFAILDDGTVLVGVDDDQGGERGHIYYRPGKGCGLSLKGHEKEQIELSIPSQGATSGGPRVHISDRAGEPVSIDSVFNA
jgi:hypothetical protein